MPEAVPHLSVRGRQHSVPSNSSHLRANRLTARHWSAALHPPTYGAGRTPRSCPMSSPPLHGKAQVGHSRVRRSHARSWRWQREPRGHTSNVEASATLRAKPAGA